jgi:predicted Zn finger-like uncharacterized protein
MSLATRCPACGTVFRVVRDQLKVSEGWVRCGRCSEVFNASQRLFELEAAAPMAEAAADGAIDAAVRLPPAAQPQPQPQPLEPPQPPQETPAPALGAAATAPTAAPIDREALAAGAAPGAATAADAPSLLSTPTPGFVLRAERAARRRGSKWRGALAALSLLLLLLLGAQIALHYRDDLAAAWPPSRPWLLTACTALGCRVEPPRHIESLSVDSSALVRIEGSPVYRLSLVVHNRSAAAVRMPAVDLALTDTQGQTMARRVLLAPELGHSADHLPARGDVALQALLDLGEQGVAGYTVELFYP